MALTHQVYNPIAPCLTRQLAMRRPLNQLSGKVIGFIDNAKPNFNHLVDELSPILMAKYGVKGVIKQRKRSASEGAPDAVIADLVAQADAVITGSGD
jgi:hypothetical protein